MEILFRGRDMKTGEWLYGNLITDDINVHDSQCFIRQIEPFNTIIEYRRVVPETVGQFTGLRDCNNRRIYEGDIVKMLDYDNDDPPYAIMMFDKDGEPDNGFRFVYNTGGTSQDEFFSEKIEVVGNIWENEDLRYEVVNQYKTESIDFWKNTIGITDY